MNFIGRLSFIDVNLVLERRRAGFFSKEGLIHHNSNDDGGKKNGVHDGKGFENGIGGNEARGKHAENADPDAEGPD